MKLKKITVMEDILVPIGICVVLPVMVVWLAMRTRQNEINKKTEVMLKAIEKGEKIDVDFFKADHGPRTIKERLLKRFSSACVTSMLGIILIFMGWLFSSRFGWNFQDGLRFMILSVGGILLAVGVALFVVFFVGKKMLEKEIAAEEKSLEQK